VASPPPIPYINSEIIKLEPLISLGFGFIDESVCTELTLNYTLTGGSFSISMLKDTLRTLPGENTVMSMPFGRLAVVKNVGTGLSSGGLVDTVSGLIVPIQATFVNFYGVEPGSSKLLSELLGFIANTGVSLETIDIPIKNFSFRGIALSGVQQLATYVLGDVIVRKDGIHVVSPGKLPSGASVFAVPRADVVSINQVVDYSLDVSAILNPALTSVQLNDEGDFVYDSQHAQKQPKFTVQAGANQGTGGTNFIPIPDGWLVDGSYEEWTPTPGADLSNPTSTTSNIYWKVFPSPSNPGQMRGITNFTRLIKQINIPGNVSTFIGSPITGLTNHSGPLEFQFYPQSTQEGIYGFEANDTIVSDVVSGQYLELANAIVLIPAGGSSGLAASNFYSVTMEIWTFPRVNPTVWPIGDPVNPFGIPKNVVVVNPNSNIGSLGSGITNYWNGYFNNYQRINSPRLRTNISVIYRNAMPEVGDRLFTQFPIRFSDDCGRIQSVSLRFGRSGLILNIVAESYQFSQGLWSSGPGSIHSF